MLARTPQSSGLVTLAFALGIFVPRSEVSAQSKLDRNVAPKVGKSPTLRVPTWTKTKLSNGAQLVVVEKHDLPLVALTIDFVGGTTSFEPADKLGVGLFTASMLSE